MTYGSPRTPHKVLLTGAGGQLGWELQQTLPVGVELIALNSRQLDVTDPQALRAVIAGQRPAVVINAAAYTAVDKAEQEREAAYAVNATAPRYLAELCAECGCRIIHISTDYVFDGNHATPYHPDDTPHPLGVYGASKEEGEQHLRRIAPERSVIIRTSWLYSSHGSNFVKTMLRLMRERDSLAVVADQIGTPTHARGLAEFIWILAGQEEASGILHWSDAGVASWYDFAVAIMEESLSLGLLERVITLRPITTAEYPTAAPRPGYSVLDKQATWSRYAIAPQHWRVALRRMLRELAAA